MSAPTDGTSKPMTFGQRQDTFLDSVVRMNMDLQYKSERDQFKQVLSSESGWECAIASVGVDGPHLPGHPPQGWSITLDLFVNEHECDEVSGSQWEEISTVPQPSQHLGLRLHGLDYDIAAALYAQIQARFDVRTGPVTFPLRDHNDD